jgi:hypothetical protein
MIPRVLALAFIIHITIIYTLLKKRNKLDKLLNTYHDRECNLIFRIILHDKSISKDELKLILNFFIYDH